MDTDHFFRSLIPPAPSSKWRCGCWWCWDTKWWFTCTSLQLDEEEREEQLQGVAGSITRANILLGPSMKEQENAWQVTIHLSRSLICFLSPNVPLTLGKWNTNWTGGQSKSWYEVKCIFIFQFVSLIIRSKKGTKCLSLYKFYSLQVCFFINLPVPQLNYWAKR